MGSERQGDERPVRLRILIIAQASDAIAYRQLIEAVGGDDISFAIKVEEAFVPQGAEAEIIVLDLGRSGKTAQLRTVRRVRTNRAEPIVVLVDELDAKAPEEFASLGPLVALAKPVKPKALMLAIRALGVGVLYRPI